MKSPIPHKKQKFRHSEVSAFERIVEKEHKLQDFNIEAIAETLTNLGNFDVTSETWQILFDDYKTRLEDELVMVATIKATLKYYKSKQNLLFSIEKDLTDMKIRVGYMKNLILKQRVEKMIKSNLDESMNLKSLLEKLEEEIRSNVKDLKYFKL
jgi:hypothetical protein